MTSPAKRLHSSSESLSPFPFFGTFFYSILILLFLSLAPVLSGEPTADLGLLDSILQVSQNFLHFPKATKKLYIPSNFSLFLSDQEERNSIINPKFANTWKGIVEAASRSLANPCKNVGFWSNVNHSSPKIYPCKAHRSAPNPPMPQAMHSPSRLPRAR